MKIGVLGSGNMGGQIGRLWAEAGHEVVFSSRNPKKLSSLIENLKNAKAGTVSEAIEFADTILLAINYWTIEEIMDRLRITPKVIIDLTNPYKWTEEGSLQRVIPENISGAETLQNQLKKSTIIKAFSSHQANTLKMHHSLPKIGVLYTCDGESGKSVSEKLIEDAGFEPIYYGNLSRSKDIELFGKFSNKIMTAEEARNEIKK